MDRIFGVKLYAFKKEDLELPKYRLLGNVKPIYKHYLSNKKDLMNYEFKKGPNEYEILTSFVCYNFKCNCKKNFKNMASFLAHVAAIETKNQFFSVLKIWD